MSVNYDRVCRLCLSSRGELLPIFPTTSSDDSEPHVLASKIKDCVAIQINENDDLPTNACRKCVDNVNNWHVFKTVCERSQNKLQSLIKKDGSQLEELNIKSEPLSDEAYDDGVVIDGAYREEAAGTSKVQPEGPPILASLGLTPRSDKNYVDPRMDWHRVHAILNMVQDDDVINSLQSAEECDMLQQSDHDSDSDIELECDLDDTYVDCKDGYKLKDHKIISKRPLISGAENNPHIKEAMALRKRSGRQCKPCPQPKHAWELIFTNDLLELIVTATNENISKNGRSFSCGTNISEIKTLIGILYFHGIMRPTHQKLKDLWHVQYGLTCIKNAMKFERVKFILENVNFYNNDDENLMQFDIMKQMRTVLEIFTLNCRSEHDIEDVAVIDEILMPVFGPAPFRFDIEKKALKSGIKMVLLVDPTNFYISNLDIITDSYFRADEIVSKLVQHLAGTGRVVVMDNWFSSYTLIEKLKHEYKLFCIAALKQKDEIIPPFFLSQDRMAKPVLVGYFDDGYTLTSQMTSQTKSVNVLTNDPKFNKKGQFMKSSAASEYKRNQSAVEVVDVLMHYYTTMQYTNSWMMSLFFTLLNIASINAQVIWSTYNREGVVKRRLFIQELALSLMKTDVSFPMSPINQPLLKNISKVKGRKRCKICAKTTKRDRRTKQYCLRCRTPICREHAVVYCTLCSV